jgi:hypothetical protein
MLSGKATVQNAAVLLLLMLFCLHVRSDVAAVNGARMQQLPRRTLWVWERPEDLRGLDKSTTAIAYLDQTVFVGIRVDSRPRSQPMTYPTGTVLIPVVRIEATPNAKLDADAERRVSAFLLRSAQRPGIAALQIDFDATRSQRTFYRNVLWQLRQQMPATLPLSMTALASWCSYDDWIGTLPVDEAVPMFFRMEPDRRRAWAGLPAFRVREPLCMRSVGVSTYEPGREPWPQGTEGKRVYIFADRGWKDDFALLAQRKLP